MALLITYIPCCADCGTYTTAIYTRRGVERFMRTHGTEHIVNIEGALPFVPQHNVGAEVDWLDRMGGTIEFDYDAVDAMREKEFVESRDWMFD